MRIVQGRTIRTKSYKRAVLREPVYYSAEQSVKPASSKEALVTEPICKTVRQISPEAASLSDIHAEQLCGDMRLPREISPKQAIVQNLLLDELSVRQGVQKKDITLEELFSSDKDNFDR